MKLNIRVLFMLAALTGAVGAVAVHGQFQQTGTQIPRQTNALFLNNFTSKLDARLKNKSVGYAFAVIDAAGNIVGGGGGDARRSPDPDPRKMTMNDKMNIASVSKTLTAAAVLKLLNQKRISVDTAIYPYLPLNWKLGANIKGLTFRDLLTHRSGIRCSGEVTYLNLRSCVEAGISLTAKAEPANYNNSNFALFRMIIPRLNGFDGGNTADNAIGDSIASGTYATLYAEYVRTKILAPAGLTGIDLKPTANPALCYQYPQPIGAGESFGDMTETSASRGWNMSAKQLAIFFHALFSTEKVVPFHVSKKMKDEQLGIWRETLGTTVSYEHGGYYPGAQNKGELHSLGITFPNGISVAVIVNSQFLSGPKPSIAKEVRAAMQEATK